MNLRGKETQFGPLQIFSRDSVGLLEKERGYKMVCIPDKQTLSKYCQIMLLIANMYSLLTVGQALL